MKVRDKLPGTYVDIVRTNRPECVHIVESCALKLGELESNPGYVLSSDDYEVARRSFVDYADAHFENIVVTTSKLRRSSVDAFRERMNLERSQNTSFAVATLTQVNYDFHTLLNFFLGGKRVFFFQDNLTEHLAHTEINVTANHIHLPFTSCMLVLTSETSIRSLHNIRGISGRRDANSGGLDFAAPISVFVTMADSKQFPDSRTLIMVAYQASPSKPDNPVYCLFKREILLRPGWLLENCLRTDWASLGVDEGVGTVIDDGVLERVTSDESFYTDGMAFYRLVLNCVLYLCSDDIDSLSRSSSRSRVLDEAAGENKPSKRSQKESYSKRLSELPYESVGDRVGPILFQRADGEAVDPQSLGGHISKNIKRYMVRGHRKWQRYGSGLSQRKLIWLKPYWKGEDIKDAVAKPYIVR